MYGLFYRLKLVSNKLKYTQNIQNYSICRLNFFLLLFLKQNLNFQIFLMFEIILKPQLIKLTKQITRKFRKY